MSQRPYSALREESGILTLSVLDGNTQIEGSIRESNAIRLRRDSEAARPSEASRPSTGPFGPPSGRPSVAPAPPGDPSLSEGLVDVDLSSSPRPSAGLGFSPSPARPSNLSGIPRYMSQQGSQYLSKSLGEALLTIFPDEQTMADRPSAEYEWMAKMIPLLWFLVGVVNNLGGTSYNDYLLKGPHPVSPTNKTLLGGVVDAFPWNLKIFFAFLSDVRPICGRRRVPYLVIGLIFQSASWIALSLLSEKMTFEFLCLQSFISTMGQMMTGVVCDTLIVENIKYESGESVGRLQSNTYLMYAVGGLIGTLLSGWLPQYGNLSNVTMFLIVGICKGGLIGLVPFLRDPCIPKERRNQSGAIGQAWTGIWSTVKLIRVLKPLLFIFVFSNFPSNSGSFNSYVIQGSPICAYNATANMCIGRLLNDQGHVQYGDFCRNLTITDGQDCVTQYGGLSFSKSQYSYIGLLGSIGSAFGSFLFRVWLIRSQWHCMFGGTLLIVVGSSLLQLPLMFRNSAGQTLNEGAHVPDIFFALGDDVVMAAANQLLSLPLNILMARLCPPGAEGTVYALVTSLQGVGGTVSGVWSKLATSYFGIENYDWSRFWQLTLLTALVKLIILPLLPLVPKNINDEGDNRSSKWAGIAIVSIFLGGLLFALSEIITTLATL